MTENVARHYDRDCGVAGVPPPRSLPSLLCCNILCHRRGNSLKVMDTFPFRRRKKRVKKRSQGFILVFCRTCIRCVFRSFLVEIQSHKSAGPSLDPVALNKVTGTTHVQRSKLENTQVSPALSYFHSMRTHESFIGASGLSAGS